MGILIAVSEAQQAAALSPWEWGWDAVAAIATFLAVLASLLIAFLAAASRRRGERKQAKAIADAFCDELRAVHWRLEQLERLQGQPNLEEAWRACERHTGALVTPVLDKFHNHIQFFDGATAAAVASAYGNILRSRELMSKWKSFPFDRAHAADFRRIIDGLNVTVTPVRTRVHAAVLALWKYTQHPNMDPFAPPPGEV